eukprot:6342843-Amphidinium_carterae.1
MSHSMRAFAEDLRNDFEIVLAAVSTAGLALQFASKRLQAVSLALRKWCFYLQSPPQLQPKSSHLQTPQFNEVDLLKSAFHLQSVDG